MYLLRIRTSKHNISTDFVTSRVLHRCKRRKLEEMVNKVFTITNTVSIQLMSMIIMACSALLPTPWFTRRIGLLWNRALKSPVVGKTKKKKKKKPFGGWPKIRLLFICLPVAGHFFLICQFPFNSERFWAFSVSKNILFINFRDHIKTSWRWINTDYPLYVEVNNCFFHPVGWFWLFYDHWKAPKFRKLGL